MTKNLITLLFLGLLSSCKGVIYPVFSIKNNSNKVLLYSYSTLYPDTSIAKVSSYKIINPEMNSEKINGPFGYGTSSNGIVEIFLFDSVVYSTTPWDTIVKKYMILKRYDLTRDSINKMGGVITYP